MPWQIQARAKVSDDDTAEWEPITFERAKLVSGIYSRRYQYETLEEAKQAFGEYVEVEGGLPNLIVRMATGSGRFTDKYEVRFVQLWPEDESQNEQPASGPGGFAAVQPGSESALREDWRVGSKVPLNIYEGDRPVCQCHTEFDAQRIVRAMNRRHLKEKPDA